MSSISPIAAPAAAAPRAARDRRRATRTCTVFRVARIITHGGDNLGIVRNISEHGVMLEVDPRIDLGDAVLLDLGFGPRLSGEVRWRKDNNVGLSFAQPLDVSRVLGKQAASVAEGKVARLPRAAVDCLAELTMAEQREQVRVVDLSIGGAGIEMATDLALRDRIALTIPGLPTRIGSVRWRRANKAGIIFDRPIPVQTLMGWLAARAVPGTGVAEPAANAPSQFTDARLAALYKASVDAVAMVVVTDRAGLIVRANQQYQDMSGYRADELAGRSYHALCAPGMPLDALEHLVPDTVWRAELCHVTRTGSLRWLTTMAVASAANPDLVTYFHFDAKAQPVAAVPRKEPEERADDTPIETFGLTRRELEILKIIASGRSNDEIAGLIGLKKKTVDCHRANIIRKIGAENTAAAIYIACKCKLI